MLAKPVHKIEFLTGKFLGVHVLLLCFTSVITLVLSIILFWRETSLIQRIGDDLSLGGSLIRYSDVFLFGFLQWMKFGILSAITLFVASFSNTNLYTIIVSFFVLIICQLQYIAHDVYSLMEAGWERFLVMLLGLIFPNFQIFNIGDQLVFNANSVIPGATIIQVLAYALIYCASFVLLAQVNFHRREI